MKVQLEAENKLMANEYKDSRGNQRNLTEDGFASIVIALVLIVVLALMTVGFATLARREQQSALNKQLANQASAAAESGINDAYSDILSGYITTATHNEGTANCITPSDIQTTDPDSKAQTLHQDIKSDHGVGYTCLMVDLTPPTLTHALSPGDAWTTVFSTTGSDALSSFDVVWNSNDGQNDPPSGPSGAHTGDTTFLPIGLGNTPATAGQQWGTAPAVLQFSITPLNAVDRSSLINNTQTFYFRPAASGTGSVTIGSTASGSVISAACSSVPNKTGSCHQVKVSITGLSGSANEYYLVHIINYYDKSQTYLTNAKDSSGNTINFSDSQVVIDVTGKARQVLKRLQVYKSLYQSQSTSSYGIEAQDICKRFSTDPVAGTLQQSSGITDPDNACHLN